MQFSSFYLMARQGRSSLFRFAIIILAIPVVLLLVLHFFGRNEMSVPVLQELASICESDGEITVVMTGAINETSVSNQLKRVERGLERKGLTLASTGITCFRDTTALHLIDSQSRLRGSYLLEQHEVNRLFVELDIVREQESYGREVSR